MFGTFWSNVYKSDTNGIITTRCVDDVLTLTYWQQCASPQSFNVDIVIEIGLLLTVIYYSD